MHDYGEQASVSLARPVDMWAAPLESWDGTP